MAAVRISRRLHVLWWLHRRLYRLSGGRIGTRVNGFEILMLTTTGRKTGQPRPVALQSLDHGTGWAVIGSRAGDDRHPDWWLNLQAEPLADVQIGSSHTRVRAREAAGEERTDVWNRFTAIDDSYDEYVHRTSRTIPVAVLEPAN